MEPVEVEPQIMLRGFHPASVHSEPTEFKAYNL
jgi:hypothetical protein